jgi:acyl transferase domain-containing protein
MFPGQGAQYVNMGLELYHAEPVFREQVDLCSKFLEPILGLDLRSILYPAEEKKDEAQRRLAQTFITQPALFVIEYALAKLWFRGA